MLKRLENKTFTGENCPKATIGLFEFLSLFKDGLFQFNSLCMLLYVQLASPIAKEESYTTMFLVISLCLVFSKVLAGFCWSISSHLLENGHYRYGRFRTLTFMGALLMSFFSMMTFFVAPLFSGWAFVIVFLIFYTLSECVFSVNDIAYWSFVNRMSLDPNKRNRITGITNLFCAIGGYGVIALVPSISAGNAKQNMTIFITVLVTLYFILNTIYCIVLTEKKENIDDFGKEKTSIFGSLSLMFKDKQVFLAVMCFFLLFISQDLMFGNSSSYFYYEFGYGSFSDKGVNGNLSGGAASFLFSISFGVMVAVSNGLYSSIAKKMKRKQILLMSVFFIMVACLLLFFFGMRRGYEIILVLSSMLLSMFQGLIFMTITMNLINTAEYYEAKTGEKKAASIQACKALAVKTANAVQTGLFYLFLAISPNLLEVNETVANMESLNSHGLLKGNIVNEVNNYIHSIDDIEKSLTIFRSTLTILPMIVLACAALLSLKVEVNDETKLAKYIEVVKSREENSEGKENG